MRREERREKREEKRREKRREEKRREEKRREEKREERREEKRREERREEKREEKGVCASNDSYTERTLCPCSQVFKLSLYHFLWGIILFMISTYQDIVIGPIDGLLYDENYGGR